MLRRPPHPNESPGCHNKPASVARGLGFMSRIISEHANIRSIMLAHGLPYGEYGDVRGCERRVAIAPQQGALRIIERENNVGFISWIIVGIVAGWLAGIITKTNRSIWGDLVLGLVGAFVAGLVTDGLVGGDAGLISSIIVAAIVAALLVWAKNFILNRS